MSDQAYAIAYLAVLFLFVLLLSADSPRPRRTLSKPLGDRTRPWSALRAISREGATGGGVR